MPPLAEAVALPLFPRNELTFVCPVIEALNTADGCFTVTSLVEVHAPLVIVHLKTYVPPVIPVTFVVGEEAVVNVGVLGPLTLLHAPVPVIGVLAAIVAVVTVQRF